MDALDAILSRRSIRQYAAEPVPEETVRTLLEAAMSAPSAGNQRPWQFVVITDRRTLEAVPRIHPYARMATEAAVAVVVCGDTRLEKHKGFWVQDCSAAIQNILIAARALGLGAVWCGIYPREERVAGFRKLLSLPPEVIPLALVPVGWPAEEKPPAGRFDERRVHYGRWERTG
jgi:nitroreductase